MRSLFLLILHICLHGLAVRFYYVTIAYLFAWTGCSILLRYYSMIIGETKYWIIISALLVIFVASIYPTILSIPTGSFNFYDQVLIV